MPHPDSVPLHGRVKAGFALTHIPVFAVNRVRGIERVALLAMGLGRIRTGASVVVFFLRHRLKVRRVDTRLVSTEMVDSQAFGNGPMRKFVGSTMGPGEPSTASPPPDAAVPSAVLGAEPKPAIFGACHRDLWPESLSQCSDNHLGPVVGERVTVSLPASVVRRAPPTLLGGLQAVVNGACHG